MRLVAILAAAACLAGAAPAAAAAPQDAKLNAVYSALAKARAANDIAGMSGSFSDTALLIDSRGMPAITGKDLAGVLTPFVERLKTENVKVATDYRIERRTWAGDTAIDVGYMRQTMTRPSGETGTRYARFMVAIKQGEGGVWKIVGDASMPSTEEAFNSVPRTDGLHYDG